MKLNGLQIEEHGSGFALTLRVHVGRKEFEDGMSDQVTEEAVGIFTTVVHSTIVFGAKRYDGSGVVGSIETVVASDDEGKDKTEASTPGSRRRQRAKAKGSREARGDKDAKADRAAKAEGGDGGEAAAKPASRRGHRAGAAKRKRDTAKASVDAKSELTNEDLSKAASEAAQSIGAPKVMEILGEFKVEKVNQLKSKQRLEFKQRLDQEVATADDGIPF